MKRFLLLLALVIVVACQGCRQKDIRVTEIKVPNVYNSACEQQVIQAITPLKGINLSSIVFEDGVLRVEYDSMQLATKNIEHAIKDAGFDANEFAADPAARAKLPRECLSMATR